MKYDETDARIAFGEAIRQAGLRVEGLPEMDGRRHYVALIDGNKRKKSGVYVGHLDGRPAGFFKNYKTQEESTWKADGAAPSMSASERAIERARIQAERAQRAQERLAREEAAAEVARRVWDAAPAAYGHPYLERKDVTAYGLKLGSPRLTVPMPDRNGRLRQRPTTGQLLVPMRDGEDRLWNLQLIDPAGRKLYLTDGRKQGTFALLGKIEAGHPLLVAEGYATGATLHGLTGFPVAVAFDSAGLAPAAQALRAKHPDLQIFLAADNDHHLPRRPQPLPNVGLEKAQAAADLVGGRVLSPPFRPEDPGSDWNDFAKQHGPDATRAAIERGLAALAPKLEKTIMSELSTADSPLSTAGRPPLGDARTTGLQDPTASERAQAEQKTKETSAPETAPRQPARDPILDVIGQLAKAGELLGERTPGLSYVIARLAVEARDRPAHIEQPLFRTRVAYALQDLEKLAEGSMAMPAELRAELTRLAGTSPGLANPRMEALVRTTPVLKDRVLIRDIRRAALETARSGDQEGPDTRERLEVLENRVRLANGPRVSPDLRPEPQLRSDRDTPPLSERPAESRPSRTVTPPASAAVEQETWPRTKPSPSDRPIPSEVPLGATERLRSGTPVPNHRQGPESLQPVPQLQVRGPGIIDQIVSAMRRPEPPTPPPWEPQFVSLTDRIDRFERKLADDRSADLVQSAERSGRAALQSVESFARGPGAGILDKIQSAASTDPGGLQGVMAEMRPGGRHADLRREFDDALQRDQGFAAAFDQAANATARYGRDRLVVNQDHAARKLDADEVAGRFHKMDEAVGAAADKLPGRIPGKSLLGELSEDVADLLRKAIAAIKRVFVREASARTGPSPSPAP